MMPVDYLFRLDADSQIGTGHLMRCLAIADALCAQGGRCAFACRTLPPTLRPKLQAYPLRELEDDSAFWPLLTALMPRWVIVDHYGLDAKFEGRVRRHGSKLLVLDDLADRRHDADLLLDQGPLRTAADYQPLLTQPCRLLLGADYALLRAEFVARRKPAATPFRRGFISFGGADPVHACLHTLQALTATAWWSRCAWTLVAGAANPDWPALQQWLAAHPARKTLAGEYARRIRRGAERTRLALAVVLTVGLTADAAETVTFHNALEAAAFRNPGHVHPVLFGEDVHGERVAEVHFRHVLELRHLTLGSGARLLEVS